MYITKPSWYDEYGRGSSMTVETVSTVSVVMTLKIAPGAAPSTRSSLSHKSRLLI